MSRFETTPDADGPTRPEPMSLVFIGTPEDDFVDAGTGYRVDGVKRIRFGRTTSGSRIRFEDETTGLRVGIPHPWVSGEHCQVELDWSVAPTMALRDLQSRNGTRLENMPVVGATGLQPGEVFELGRTFWMLRRSAPDVAAVPDADPAYAPMFATLSSTLLGVAIADVPVLILGESGTGKEQLARALHRHSGRTGDFVPVALAGIDEDTLVRRLIGSRRCSVPSFIEQAEGGTLFITGLSAIGLRAQARLRSALSRAVEGRGSKRRDVRIVAASAENLRRRVADRSFRPELYARVAGVELTLPPLRARRDRLGALIRGLAQTRPDERLHLSTRAFRFALSHQWPHNVRELRHALWAAHYASSERGQINLAVLEEVLAGNPPHTATGKPST